MVDKADGQTPDTPEAGLRLQLATMSEALQLSDQRRSLVWMSVAAVAVILAAAGGQLLLNSWNKPFYDAIEAKNAPAFLQQLLVFSGIALLLLVLGVAQTWLNLMVRLRMREAFTLDLIREWMKPGRAFRLANAGAIGVNPDQRMQQDAGHLADMVTGLSFGFVQSTLLLISFIGVLWSLSAGFTFVHGGQSIAVPGYMVWAVFIYAGTAAAISWLVGRPLIGLNAERYSREAELRAAMVRVNENADAVSLARGEADARHQLVADLAVLVAVIRRTYRVQIWLEWVTDGYGWLTLVAPILVAAPIYFTTDMTFGGLMMAVGAFNQVHSSLRWFVNNIGAIADWRATLLRVSSYRLALKDADRLHGPQPTIEIMTNKDKRLTFSGVEIRSPSGKTTFERSTNVIKPGERVLISGDPGAGKTLLFRALGGLWPWGKGRIGLPKDGNTVFVPRMPYFPPGTLRDAIAYPRQGDGPSDSEIVGLLEQVGLNGLAGSLDRHDRWDRELDEEQQRLLGFVRAVVARPDWVIIDAALDTLPTQDRDNVLAMLERQLPEAAIINIGRVLPGVKFFRRRIGLGRDPAAPGIKRAAFVSRSQSQTG